MKYSFHLNCKLMGVAQWLKELTTLFAHDVIYFYYFIAISMTGCQTVWKTSFKA